MKRSGQKIYILCSQCIFVWIWQHWFVFVFIGPLYLKYAEIKTRWYWMKVAIIVFRMDLFLYLMTNLCLCLMTWICNWFFLFILPWYSKCIEITTRWYWMQLGVIVLRMDCFNNIVPQWLRSYKQAHKCQNINWFQLLVIFDHFEWISESPKLSSVPSFWSRKRHELKPFQLSVKLTSHGKGDQSW